MWSGSGGENLSTPLPATQQDKERRPCGNCPTGRQSSLKKFGSNISNDLRPTIGGNSFIWAIF